jgi:hypothetical protein
MSLKSAMTEREAKTCKFYKTMQVFSKADKETFAQWIEQRKPARAIVFAIRTEYPQDSIVAATLHDHLRGQCPCPSGTEFKGAWH